MSAILATLDAHWAALYAARGIEIQYTSEGMSNTIKVVADVTQFERDTAEGVIETFESRIFITKPDFLISRPRRYDKITEIDQYNENHEYQVVHPLGSRHWEYMGESRALIRIFTVEVLT